MYNLKAKTNKFVIILSVLLSAVFAFTVGATYSAYSMSITLSTNTSRSSYMAKQAYAIINDSTNSPVLFGQNTNLCELAITYSYSYDFDIRIKYSLSWSTFSGETEEMDTDNVIFTMPNRDNFIVDNNYIYVRDSVSAGTDKLTIISAISFADPSDEDYIGRTLTITVEEVSIYKASSSTSDYTTSHALYVTGSEASQAWINYKGQTLSSGTAYVIAYNYRYDYSHGISHPGVATAYYNTATGSTTVAQYGNRYYGGIGMYIVTGASSVKITALAVGYWKDSSGATGSNSSLVFENNIRFNYSSGWSYYESFDNVFDTMYYELLIPSYSAVYIEAVESIEITSLGTLSYANYSSYKMVSALTINNISFDFSSSNISSNQISTVTISSSDTNSYSQDALLVQNSSVYNPYLYSETSTSSAAQISYVPTSVLVTNNSSNSLSIATEATLLVVYSNGKTSSDSWVRNSFISSNLTYSINSHIAIEPYSTIDLLDYYSINANLYSELISAAGVSCDAWVSLVISYSTSDNTSNVTDLDVLTSARYATSGVIYYDLFVKNNTSNTISNITFNMALYTSSVTYTTLSSEPSDWAYRYWTYYYLNDGEYVQNTNSTFSAQTYYTKNTTYSSLSTTISSLYNGFSGSSGAYSSSTLTLLPGESAMVGTLTVSDGGNAELHKCYGSTYLNASGTIASTTIDLVNEGTENAYIINNTIATAYYVRFTGSLTGTNSRFSTIEDYNYFVGVVYPGQLINVSMTFNSSADYNIKIEVIEANYYSSSTPSSWGDSVVELFDSYFGSK